jgi:hypothetical protein
MTEPHVIRLVITLLGGIALVGLIGTIALVAVGTDVATVAVIATMTGGAIGNLGSMLARPGEAPAAELDPVPPTQPSAV